MTGHGARGLDYCATRALVGADAADEMFGRRLPAGIDMDHLADQDMAAAIVAERAACEACAQHHHCFAEEE